MLRQNVHHMPRQAVLPQEAAAYPLFLPGIVDSWIGAKWLLEHDAIPERDAGGDMEGWTLLELQSD